MTRSVSQQAGLDILRASTVAFIQDDPTTIALKIGRGTAVEKPGGGQDFTTGGTRDPQQFKVISQNSDSTAKGDGDSGQTLSRPYILLGAHDSIAAVGDWWSDGPNRYVITELLVENDYERKWILDSQGPEFNYG